MYCHQIVFLFLVLLFLQCKPLNTVDSNEHLIEISPNEAYNSDPILVNTNHKKLVKLKIASNLTSGYDWKIVEKKKNAHRLDYEYKNGLSNATGYTVFSITNLSKNDTLIQLIYKRSFDAEYLYKKHVIKLN